MNEAKALEVIEKLDIYMLNNLTENNTLQNPYDIQARRGMDFLEQINKSLEVNETLKKRAEYLYSALKVAALRSNDNAEQAKTYFEHVHGTKGIFEKGITDTDEALKMAEIALETKNTPNDQIIEYISAQSVAGRLTMQQSKKFEELMPIINDISELETQIKAKQEINNTNDQTKALIVRKEKQSIFKKIIDFFKGLKKENVKDSPRKQTTNELPQEELPTTNESPSIKKEPNFIETIKVETQPQPQYKASQNIEPEHIVVSDLHGDIKKWGEVKKLIQKNPNIKVTMLGDAMDRGDYGPEILLQIKELSEQGRIDYLPGNHDIFAYNYLKAPHNTRSHIMAQAHLERNHGEITMQKLDDFDNMVKAELAKGNISKSVSVQELAEWLGKQPIQKKAQENGINYALSHAIFDEELYQYDKNFNLEKALSLELENGSNSEVYNKFMNCLWYREDDKRTQYSEVSYPEGCAVVVGHTPQASGINMKANFKGDPGKILIYVDTGRRGLQGYNLTKGKEFDFDGQVR